MDSAVKFSYNFTPRWFKSNLNWEQGSQHLQDPLNRWKEKRGRYGNEKRKFHFTMAIVRWQLLRCLTAEDKDRCLAGARGHGPTDSDHATLLLSWSLPTFCSVWLCLPRPPTEMLGHWGGTKGAGQFGKELPGCVYPAARTRGAVLEITNFWCARMERPRATIWEDDQIYSYTSVVQKYEATDCRRLWVKYSEHFPINLVLILNQLISAKSNDFTPVLLIDCELAYFSAQNTALFHIYS